jgi:steroid delta-isomerase-like uncharacterized protein
MMMQATTGLSEALRQSRAAIVRAHIEAENRHDIEAAIATFHTPRYEVIPFGGATDGAEAVQGLLHGLLTGYPDLHIVISTIHHAERAVIVEGSLTGTQLGAWLGRPPTGHKMETPFAAFFEFDEDRLLCERIYFDTATMMRQA